MSQASDHEQGSVNKEHKKLRDKADELGRISNNIASGC